MRPILFEIPISWAIHNILWITLLLGALLLGYIIWSWIVKKEAFPWDVAVFFVVVFAGGIYLFVQRDRMDFPSQIPIYAYGFMLMLGFACAIGMTAYRAKVRGIDPDRIFDISMYIVVTGILGSRFFYVFVEASNEYANESWTAVFRLWEGGLTFYGGLIGATVATVVYIWYYKLKPLKLMDLLSPAVALGLAFGRMGCFLNGCCWGKAVEGQTWLPTMEWPAGTLCFQDQVSKGIITSGAEYSMPAYLTQMYSSVLALLLCGALLFFARYWQKRQGTVFSLFLILYGMERFLVEYYRADNAVVYLGGNFTVSQMVSMSGILLGIGVLILAIKLDRPARDWEEDSSKRDEEKKSEDSQSKSKKEKKDENDKGDESS